MAEKLRTFFTVSDFGGASGYLPQNTIEAADLAMRLGTQYVIPEVCMSGDSDGENFTPIVIHNCHIGPDNTDIMEHSIYWNDEDYCRSTFIDGEKLCSIKNFSTEQLKELKVRQVHGDKGDRFNDIFSIPTLEEYLQNVADFNNTYDKQVGVILSLVNIKDFDLGENPYLLGIAVAIKNVYGEFETEPPNLDLSHQREIVILSDSDTLLKHMRRDGMMKHFPFPMIYLWQENIHNPYSWPTDDELENIAALEVQGFMAPAYSFIANISDAYKMAQSVKNYGLALYTHSRGKVSKSDRNYYMACCLEVDGMVSDYPDELKQVQCALKQNMQYFCGLYDEHVDYVRPPFTPLLTTTTIYTTKIDTHTTTPTVGSDNGGLIAGAACGGIVGVGLIIAGLMAKGVLSFNNPRDKKPKFQIIGEYDDNKTILSDGFTEASEVL